MATITEDEEDQIKGANSSGRTPVVFIHGLWLLPSSWDRWAAVFEEAGYVKKQPGSQPLHSKKFLWRWWPC